MVNNIYERTDFNTYEYSLNQLTILDKQTSFINNDGYMYVLNSSLFIDIDLFGKKLYFHDRGERLFYDDELLNSVKNK